MKNSQLFIDGCWQNSTDTMIVTNPGDGTQLGTAAKASQEQVDLAVAAARRALVGWSALPVGERAAVIDRAADGLVARYGKPGELTPLKELIRDEVGKRLPEADIEVIESSDMLRYFVREGARLLESRALQLDAQLWPTKQSRVEFEPVGVVAVVKPWNYPLELPIWSLGAALIAGNTVVFKPSEHSSLVGCEIAKIFAEAGIPPGVLNVLTGDKETGSLLVRHPDVDMVSFTGSVRAGREIASECASRFRRCSLELGGNDAALVARDADIELTSNGLVWGAFCNSGQVCVRPKRLFVDRTIAGVLIERLLAKTAALRPGIDLGPMISAEQLSLVNRQVAAAVVKGARVLAGGAADVSQPGYFYQPTILDNVDETMGLMSEECFGPVLPIILVDDLDHGVTLANRSKYGLGASVWTSDRAAGERVARALQVGMVWVNDVNVAFPEAPWSGRKSSGGGTELSEWSLREYTQLKHINIDVSDDRRRAWWYPYEG